MIHSLKNVVRAVGTCFSLAILVALPAQARKINVITATTDMISRAQGDVHPLGNPHYWLDPDSGRRIAKGIADKLSEMQPSEAAYFQQRYADFNQRLTAAEKKWDDEMKPYHGSKVVNYH